MQLNFGEVSEERQNRQNLYPLIINIISILFNKAVTTKLLVTVLLENTNAKSPK